MKYNIIVLFCFLVLSLIYVHPAEVFLFSGDKEYFLSDGTDHTAQSYQASILKSEFELNPLSILYGSIPTRVFNAPYGIGIWYSWSERVLVLLLSYVVPLEQIVTYDVILMFFFTAVSMYFLGRELAWSRTLSFFAAYCWAFSCYTRARAPVHSTFVGLWHVPLLLLGLLIIKRSGSKKDLSIGASLLFISATTAHYYLVITAVISPLILWYFVAQESWRNCLVFLRRVFLCFVPVFVLLGVTFFKSIPSEFAKSGVSPHPTTGVSDQDCHPYLFLMGIKPLYLLGGDYSIGDFEIIPFKKKIAKKIFTSEFRRGLGIVQERAHGMRWTIIAIVLFGIINVLCSKEQKSKLYFHKNIFPWLCIAVVGFMLASPPSNFFGHTSGVSYWTNKIISQFRVPNRASIMIQFSFIFIAASFFHFKQISTKAILLFLTFAFIELPPFVNNMPISRIAAKHTSLTNLSDEKCGLGMYFPYVSNEHEPLKYYNFLQRMRGSRCGIINSNSPLPRDDYFYAKFPFAKKVIAQINDPSSSKRAEFVRLAKCIPIDWIVFDSHIQVDARKDICRQMGFQMLEPEVCKSQKRVDPELYKEECFNAP